MTNPSQILDAIERALKQASQMSFVESYVTHEIDDDGEDADLYLPAVEIQPIDVIRDSGPSSDLVDYVTNDQGERIGRLLDVYYNMQVQIDIWTIPDSDYENANVLGKKLQKALYKYDDSVGQRLLPEGNGTVLNEVDSFLVANGERADDLSPHPSVRRWRQTVELDYYQRINTAEEYGPTPTIKGVETPKDGDFYDTPGGPAIRGRPDHFQN